MIITSGNAVHRGGETDKEMAFSTDELWLAIEK